MCAYSTLLKITDYPFIYSILVIYSIYSGITMSDLVSIPLLFITGMIATFFAILDPVGLIIKRLIIHLIGNKTAYCNYINIKSKYYHKIKHRNIPFDHNIKSPLDKYLVDGNPIDPYYLEHAVHTKSIETEKDKIVSSIYFLFVLISFIIFYLSPQFTNFVGVFENKLICTSVCASYYIPIFVIIVSVLVSIKIIAELREIMERTLTTGIYAYAVAKLTMPDTRVENLRMLIESSSWKLAEVWRDKFRISS